MSVKIAINGFGRIGRNVLRAARNTSEFEIVAINDLTSPQTLAHLLKYDSIHGIFAADISTTEDDLTVDGKLIKVFSERDPAAHKTRPLPDIQIGGDSESLFLGHEFAKLGGHKPANTAEFF